MMQKDKILLPERRKIIDFFVGKAKNK